MFGAQSSPFGASQPSGGLFGTPSTGGLFGSARPASGGLFGAPSPSPGTLFGAPQSGGGLFGAQQPAAPFGGAPQSSASLFGAPASSGGLFGATSQSSLFGGGATAGLFGTPASSAGLFGTPAASSSLFGAPAASGGLFGSPAGSGGLGGSAGGLFGTPASGGLFGSPVSSGGLFGAPAASGGLFQGGLFGASQGGGMFGAQSTPGMFGAVQAPQQPQQPQQMQVDIGKDGRPITHDTLYTNLPDQWQNAFKQVHSALVEVRRDYRALKSSVGVLESSGPEQEHAGLSEASKQLRADLETARKVLDLDSYAADGFHADMVMLAEATQAAHDQLRANVVRRDIENTRVEAQKQSKMMQHAHVFKSLPPLPAPFLGSAVEGCAVQLQRLSEMQQSLAALLPSGGGSQATDETLASLPDVLRSLHEFFLHVAARVAQLRCGAERMREAHLQAQAAQGNFFDPFAEADAEEEMQAAERNRVPAIQAVKPQLQGVGQSSQPSGGAVGVGGTIGFGGGAATQLSLTAPASSSSLLGGGYGSGGARSTIKAKRR